MIDLDSDQAPRAGGTQAVEEPPVDVAHRKRTSSDGSSGVHPDEPSSDGFTDDRHQAEPPLDKWVDELHQNPKARGVWEGPKGTAIMVFGVVLPSLFLVLFGALCHERISMLLIKHPLETLVEIALALSVPCGNFSIWSAICRRDLRFAMRRGLQNGLSIGVSALFLIVSVAAIFMGRVNVYFLHELQAFAQGFAVIALIFFASMLTSVYLAYELRELREFKSAKLRTTIYSVLGVILAVLGLTGAEAKSMYMRIAEHMAFAGANHDEQIAGLKALRSLNAEQDMRLECADPRTVGLPGLFIPINSSTQQQLYFAAFGKPFRDDRSADLSGFSNDYLRRHVVGALIPELSLVRSGMDGSVNPETLSSTLSWTFVFKNTSYQEQEARAEFALPPGAVVSNVTVWQDGQPVEAKFAASGEAPTSSNFASADHNTPAVVSDLGRGRILLHCYPVNAQDELKVRMTMVMPLKLETVEQATLALPRFIDTNFNVNGEHQVRLRSPERLSLSLGGLKESLSPTRERLLAGTLKNEELSGLGISVTAARKPTLGAVAVTDPFAGGAASNRYILQTIQAKPVKIPNHLIVVLDGSQNVKSDLEQIKSGLAALPSNVTSSLIVASDASPKLQELQPLHSGLAKLTQSDFDGGQDNLQAVVKAASTAGETKDGGVLWIHGPQPTLNKELYVMAPYIQTPSFYELALDNGVTDGNEFFKNHREIGPFSPVSRNGSIKNDLTRFVSRWQPGGVEYVVKLAPQSTLPTATPATAQQAVELSHLCAQEQSHAFISHGDLRNASAVAVEHHLVTPVSSAVVMRTSLAARQSVLQEQADAQNEDAKSVDARSEEVNTDSTFITGVNTAGTVRVNNLANLEALLNLLANSVEIVGILYGLAIIVQAALFQTAYAKYFGMKGASVPLMIVTGVIMVAAGLCFPGIVNWFVASARDANLFS